MRTLGFILKTSEVFSGDEEENMQNVLLASHSFSNF